MCVESKCIQWERGAAARVMEQVLNGARDRDGGQQGGKCIRIRSISIQWETGAGLCLKHRDAARKGKCKQSKKSPPKSRHSSSSLPCPSRARHTAGGGDHVSNLPSGAGDVGTRTALPLARAPPAEPGPSDLCRMVRSSVSF